MERKTGSIAPDVSLQDCIGTLTMNLMNLRRVDFDAYITLGNEWIDQVWYVTNRMAEDSAKHYVLGLEGRVIAAIDKALKEI
jgi:hypothetical protein